MRGVVELMPGSNTSAASMIFQLPSSIIRRCGGVALYFRGVDCGLALLVKAVGPVGPVSISLWLVQVPCQSLGGEK